MRGREIAACVVLAACALAAVYLLVRAGIAWAGSFGPCPDDDYGECQWAHAAAGFEAASWGWRAVMALIGAGAACAYLAEGEGG